MRRWGAGIVGAVILAAIGTAHAQPPPDLAVAAASGLTTQMSWAALQALPAAALMLKGERGDAIPLAGPTLWTVLEQAGAIDANFHRRVGQVVVATGRDGYSATLAMGELDPEFENKGVLLAIDPERHSLRIAIPGDKRLGRDVRDVVRLAVRDGGR